MDKPTERRIQLGGQGQFSITQEPDDLIALHLYNAVMRPPQHTLYFDAYSLRELLDALVMTGTGRRLLAELLARLERYDG